MRANARAIFGGAVVGLVLVTGWWTWREIAHEEEVSTNTSIASIEKPQPDIGLVAFMDKQLEGYSAPLPANPFFADQPEKNDNRNRKAPADDEVFDPAADPPDDPQNNKPKNNNPNVPRQPEKKKEVVSLTYRGMVKLSDGKLMAVVQDTMTKQTKFYDIHSEIFGMSIKALAEREATITDSVGAEVLLPFGTPVKFEDGKHAD